MVGMVLRLGRTSRDVRREVSSRPQHPRVLRYFHHRHLWTMACSCKAWSRRCRRRLRYRPSCRRRSSPNAGGTSAESVEIESNHEGHLFGLAEEGFITQIRSSGSFIEASEASIPEIEEEVERSNSEREE
ncbi:hypothetical protein Taro_053381, partial [Colocasia esculenta]|nr:hypothetical protein [Colocasia esculenta]